MEIPVDKLAEIIEKLPNPDEYYSNVIDMPLIDFEVVKPTDALIHKNSRNMKVRFTKGYPMNNRKTKSVFIWYLTGVFAL